MKSSTLNPQNNVRKIAKKVVALSGIALGNLIYRSYNGQIYDRTGEWSEKERDLVAGTKYFLLGGSIGTNGFTRHWIPKIAMEQIRLRSKREKTETFSKIKIIKTQVSSHEAGALGAEFALSKMAKLKIKKHALKVLSENKVPIQLFIDIGGTTTTVALSLMDQFGEFSGNILKSYNLATPKGFTPQAFYDQLASFLHPIIRSFEKPPYDLTPYIAVGQPGKFSSPDGVIISGAKDLGADFIGENPALLLSKYLTNRGLGTFKVHICNDGRAQFYGIVNYLKKNQPETYSEISTSHSSKIMYLGIGTGLGIGHGYIQNGNLIVNEIGHANNILANDKLSDLIDLKISKKLFGKNFIEFPYTYGELISSKFFRKSMHAIELKRLQKNGIDNSRTYFFPFLGMNSLPDSIKEKLLLNGHEFSPLNPILINKILENEPLNIIG